MEDCFLYWNIPCSTWPIWCRSMYYSIILLRDPIAVSNFLLSTKLSFFVLKFFKWTDWPILTSYSLLHEILRKSDLVAAEREEDPLITADIPLAVDTHQLYSSSRFANSHGTEFSALVFFFSSAIQTLVCMMKKSTNSHNTSKNN